MANRQYSVWHDNQEQWDPDHIDEPALQCQARNFIEAAEKLADDYDSSYAELIVRDDESNTYHHIVLVRGWEVKRDNLTSLAELSAP